MSMLIFVIALQASIISGGDIRPEGAVIERSSSGPSLHNSQAEIQNEQRSPSSAQRPLAPSRSSDVDENSVIREQIVLGRDMARGGFKPNPQPLPMEPYPGCRRIDRIPMGVKLTGSDVTNGLSDLYKCPQFSAVVTYLDVAAPIGGTVTIGFPDAETAAVINGGALSRSFYATPGKGARVTDMWIGKRQGVTVSLISNSLSLKDMQTKADLMTETITKAFL
ncbi:hypothetical protein [Sphingomonas parapaucimobilis]